jgi:hypothetical protein
LFSALLTPSSKTRYWSDVSAKFNSDWLIE